MAATDTAAHADTADAADTGEHHPTPRFYIQVAVVLGILTAMEFSTYFIDFGPATVPMLLVLMAIKFALIVGFFMHLKFDTDLYSKLMLMGLIGALVLYVAVAAISFEFPALPV